MNVEKVSADLQCLGHTITNLDFQTQMVRLEDNNETKKTFDLSHEVGQISLTEEEKKKIGAINLFIEVEIEEDSRKLALNFSIEGCFTVNSEISDEEFEKLLSQNGLATIYSSARAIISSFSAQALNGGNIILPMINVLKYSKEIKSNAKN